ncbi:MAG: hypothetical protein N3I35_08745 [Clostridia bacterium]|nr:hypothetical protein [Clostridia bacterium]
MSEENKTLIEIYEMLKMLVDGQKQLIESINEIKAEQKKMHEEIKLNNFVLNNITMRNEILN